MRVWFAPIQGLGTTRWPLNGFIYPDKPPRLAAPRTVLASADVKAPYRSRIGSDFLKGVRPEAAAQQRLGERVRVRPAQQKRPGRRAADPIGEIIARVS